LVLFAAVQITTIAVGLYTGERTGILEWLGLLIAIAGLIYLVSPGVSAPSTAGSVLMATAGIAWGVTPSEAAAPVTLSGSLRTIFCARCP